MALPLHILLLSPKETFKFSLRVYVFSGIFFFKRFVYSAIGSRVQFFFGLISSIERLIFYNWLICSFICFSFLMLLLFSYYWLFSYHLDLGENTFINPLNSFGLENSNLLMYEALNINYALLLPIGPFMKFNNLRKDNYFNSYLKLIRYSSFNHHIKDNSDIYNKILNKDLKNMIGSGYYAYKNIFSLGYLIELIDNKTLFVNKLTIYLENLDDNKTYSLLPVIR